jgi:16S rRNA processing protein RimM
MDYLYIGYVSGTHGIKGELKIKSNFWYKDKVFVKDKYLYLGKNHEKMIINNYRPHKEFDMVLLNDYQNINDVLKYIGSNVYVLRKDLELDKGEYTESDLIGMEVIDNDKLIGHITEIRYLTKSKKIIVIEDNKLLPFEKEFIKSVDLENKKVYINSIEGMF